VHLPNAVIKEAVSMYRQALKVEGDVEWGREERKVKI
jgi:hypothetical protein